MRPLVALLMVVAIGAVMLAWTSAAYPLALTGLPPALFALFGPNPLPSGAVTGALAAWTALAILFAIIKRQDPVPLGVILAPPTMATIALGAWMLFRLGGSPAGGYGTEKLQLFFAGNVAFLLGGIFVGWRRQHLRLLLWLVLVVATVGAAVLTVRFLSGEAETIFPDRFSISPENDPISLGRESATGLLVAMYLVLARGAGGVRALGLAVLPILAIALVATGSRGPVVGVIAGVFVFAALAATTRSARRRLLLVALGAVACVAVVPLVVPDAAISRSLSVFSVSNVDLSSNGRTELWSLALDTFANNTALGIGTGGFSAIQQGEAYPHNLFLEAAAELGVIGLALVSVLLVSVTSRLVAAWRWTADQDRLMVAAVLALFSTGLVNSLFSGGVEGNRVIWLWAGVGVGLAGRLLGEARTRKSGETVLPQAPRARAAW